MINTFIFLDLETTGLIRGNLMPKITEMSLIAVSRNAMCNSRGVLPRVLQKLVLAINPETTIPKRVVDLTGLSNDLLENIECFNSDTCDLFIKFLRLQTAPVCFVAYNGNRFDYPILLSELKNIDQTLSENVLSIDMMHLVQEFYSSKKRLESAYDHLLNDGCDEILAEALDATMKSIVKIDHDNHCESEVCIIYDAEESMHSCNGANDSSGNRYAKRMQAANEKTPENRIIKSRKPNNVNSKMTTARRQLDFTHTPPSNFKLNAVFKHIYGTEPGNMHSAEGDCLTMIHCAVKLEDFVQRADASAVPLINFKKA